MTGSPGVCGVAPGQPDASGRQEVPHAVVTRLAVDEVAVILLGEGPPVLAGRLRPRAEIAVEEFLPSRLVQRGGVGDHPVEVEQDRVVEAGIDRTSHPLTLGHPHKGPMPLTACVDSQ